MLSICISLPLMAMTEKFLCSPLPMESNNKIISKSSQADASTSGEPLPKADRRFSLWCDEDDMREHVGDLLQDPRLLGSTDEENYRERMMEYNLARHNFNTVYPHGGSIRPFEEVSCKGHVYGREMWTGHVDNTQEIQDWIDRKWPLESTLTLEQIKERANAGKTLQTSLQAMRYLDGRLNAVIYHEPSGVMYLSPDIQYKHLDDIHEAWGNGQFPKLRYKDRLHFKTSDEKKADHRKPFLGRGNGRTMEEETSSEEEEL